jgi:hypothetical protein
MIFGIVSAGNGFWHAEIDRVYVDSQVVAAYTRVYATSISNLL